MASTFTPYAGLSDTIQAVGAAGQTKTQLSLGQLFTLGFIAAAYLSFATTLSIVAGAGIETIGLQKLVMGVVFPIGLISLVIGGGEMWTGSSMNAPVAGMTGHARWENVLYTLIGSYAGNFAGGLFCAWLLIKGGNVLIGPGYASPAWGEMLHKLTLMKVSLSFSQAFWRAFACVWLVDLAPLVGGVPVVPCPGQRRQILARVVSGRHLLYDGPGAQRGQHVPHPGRHHGGCPGHLGPVLLLQPNSGDAGQCCRRRHLPWPGLLVCRRYAGAQRDRGPWG